MEISVVCLAAHKGKLLRWTLQETSNCYCHPGKAGGFPIFNNWEKMSALAAAVSAIVAVFTLWPSPSPKPGPNTIRIVDASYVSKYTPRKRSSIWPHVHDACESRTFCDFHCDNAHSDGDPDKGTDKRCIINYICSNTPNSKINFDVLEDEKNTHRMSCPQSN